MGELRKVQVLQSFDKFLWLLEAYNCENLSGKKRNLCLVFVMFVVITSFPTITILATWNFVDLNYDLHQIAAGGPIVLSLLQICLTIIVLLMKNRQIEQLIARFQDVIDQRMGFFY